MNKNLVAIRLKNNPTPCEADRQKNFGFLSFFTKIYVYFPVGGMSPMSPSLTATSAYPFIISS